MKGGFVLFRLHALSNLLPHCGRLPAKPRVCSRRNRPAGVGETPRPVLVSRLTYKSDSSRSTAFVSAGGVRPTISAAPTMLPADPADAGDRRSFPDARHQFVRDSRHLGRKTDRGHARRDTVLLHHARYGAAFVAVSHPCHMVAPSRTRRIARGVSSLESRHAIALGEASGLSEVIPMVMAGKTM